MTFWISENSFVDDDIIERLPRLNHELNDMRNSIKAKPMLVQIVTKWSRKNCPSLESVVDGLMTLRERLHLLRELRKCCWKHEEVSVVVAIIGQSQLSGQNVINIA